MKTYTTIILLLMLGLNACDEGPAERLGQDIDNAAEDLGNAVEDACEEVSDRPC